MGLIRVEVEIEDREGISVIEVEGGSVAAVLAGVGALAGLDDIYVFERDRDEPIGAEIEGKKSVSVHAHRSNEVLVKIRYEHLTKERHFSPAATVFKVLQWAISKHAFSLDDTAKARAHLMLPGETAPLENAAVIGHSVKYHHRDHRHDLTLDLTLKDFTNG